MRRTRFCSACGEPIKTKHVTFPALALLCARCSPHFRRERLLVIGACFLCLSAVFAIARYTAPAEPFSFIGTPVQSSTERHEPSTGALAGTNPASSIVQGVKPSTESRGSVESICGAPTKSGRPCRRKVKDGGYCWQHRDKSGVNSQHLMRR
jgi:hypothetical protein